MNVVKLNKTILKITIFMGLYKSSPVMLGNNVLWGKIEELVWYTYGL